MGASAGVLSSGLLSRGLPSGMGVVWADKSGCSCLPNPQK